MLKGLTTTVLKTPKRGKCVLHAFGNDVYCFFFMHGTAWEECGVSKKNTTVFRLVSGL